MKIVSLRLWKLVLVAMVVLVGCHPTTAVGVVNQAVHQNNMMVTALDSMQNTARESRKREMMEAARSAETYDAGKREIDNIDNRYQKFFDALRKAHVVQNKLADLLELVMRQVKAGQYPSLSQVLQTYAELQQVYQELLQEVFNTGSGK